MKLLNIINETEKPVDENIGVILKAAGKNASKVKSAIDDVFAFALNDKPFYKGANKAGGQFKNSDELIASMKAGKLTSEAATQLAQGLLKTNKCPLDIQKLLVNEIASGTNWSNLMGKVKSEKSLRTRWNKKGYTDETVELMIQKAKDQKVGPFGKTTTKGGATGTKGGATGTKGGATGTKVDPKTLKGRFIKVYNDTASYLKGNKNAAKNLGNLPKSSRTVRLAKWIVRTSVKGVVKMWTLKWLIILGLGGYIAWNWKEWMGLGDLTKWDNDDFEPEVDFLKCILIPLGDDEGVKIESDDKGNPVLHYTKGSSYDDQGGLIFRVDGSVETGDGSKKGTWSCNTSGLDIQEQSTGSEITSKQLSIAMEDLNDNLSGDLLDGDSTDMMDALNIVKGIEGKTYKSSTAIKTLIHNYPKVYKTSLVDDINNLSNLDFEGMERKEELLGILGLSSGKSSGGNQSGDSDTKGDGNTSTGISHITIKWGSGETAPVVGKVKYVQCKDLPFKYGCISDKIKTIQKCLPAELKVDGYYGPKTSNALWNLYQGKEKGDITKSVYDKIMVACNKKDDKTKSTEPRKKVEPLTKLQSKGLAPLKIYNTDAVIAKIDPVVMAANIQKTIDGRRIDSIIANDLKYSGGRYVLKIDDELTDNQLKTINLYMASKGFKVLRKKRETLDGSKYVWKADSKDAKRIARRERSIKKDQDKINDLKNKDNE
mgnify:CR=1 FL=1